MRDPYVTERGLSTKLLPAGSGLAGWLFTVAERAASPSPPPCTE